jgi:hypothetical protein
LTPTPTLTPTPSGPDGEGLQGDIDCNRMIDARDALAVLRAIAGMPAAGCATTADVDCDGEAGILDALTILRYVAQIRSVEDGSCPKVGSTRV